MNSQFHVAKVLPKGNSHSSRLKEGKMGPRTDLDNWKNDCPQSAAQNLMPSP
jgi:hypothetical protein